MQTVIRCEHPKCNKDITKEIKVYDNGKVWCEECNLKVKNSYYE